MLRRLLFFSLTLLLPLVVQAQPLTYYEALDRTLLDLDFAKAKHSISVIPDRWEQTFYQHHLCFLQAFVQQDTASVTRFWTEAPLLYNTVKAMPKGEEKYFFLAEMMVERAFLHVMRREYTSAASALKTGYDHLIDLKERYPESTAGWRVEGMYKVAFSGVPKKYQWVMKLLGYRADLLEGMRMLEECSIASRHLRGQTQAILYFAERNLLKDPVAAYSRARLAHKTYPASPIFAYMAVSAALDRKDHAAAERLLSQWMLAHPGQIKRFPLVQYLAGRLYLYSGQHETALRYLSTYQNSGAGALYLADAWYKSAIAYAQLGQRDRSMQCLRNAVNVPQSGFDEDQYAAREAARLLDHWFTAQDLQFMAARLAYDGGLLDKALTQLNALDARKNSMDSPQLTELYYRYGRVYHAQNRLPEARAAYLKASTTQPGINLWMKAYAHLYLAEIAEHLRDWPEATRQYEAALSLDDYPYQQGLEQKAKAGLHRISTQK